MALPTDDPVASSVEWTPLKKGGASFRTHRLIEINPNRMEFKASIGYKVLVYSVLGFFFLFSSAVLSGFGGLVGFFVNLLIIAYAWSKLKHLFIRPIIFDKTEGYFWKGKKSPAKAASLEEIKVVANLNDLHALQIIDEYVPPTGDKGSGFHSYEINLVLHSGERLNVVDYGNKIGIAEDAAKLASFLNLGVWTSGSRK